MAEQHLKSLSINLEIELTERSYEENFNKLAEHIDYLIRHDFNKLMSVLYRVDVYEHKLKKALADNPENQLSGRIIARLLVEREAEKAKYREMYKS